MRAMRVEPSVPRITILQVSGCPLVGRVRETVQKALTHCGIWEEIGEVVGDYPSPTLLIDGRDVTGRAGGECSACRLDLPSEKQVVAALRRNA